MQSRAKELPEVDDEFASDVSEKAETLDAYRAEVKAQIKERKENEGKAKKEDQAVEQAVANAADRYSGTNGRPSG